MALDPQISDAAANAAANAVGALLNNGFLLIYGGIQPANANTPVSSQTLLATLRFGNPAFLAAVQGVIVTNPITPDVDAAASGTATWFRTLAADGQTVVFDGSVDISGANLNLNNVNITQHATVAVSGFSYTQNED